MSSCRKRYILWPSGLWRRQMRSFGTRFVYVLGKSIWSSTITWSLMTSFKFWRSHALESRMMVVVKFHRIWAKTRMRIMTNRSRIFCLRHLLLRSRCAIRRRTSRGWRKYTLKLWIWKPSFLTQELWELLKNAVEKCIWLRKDGRRL